MSHKLKSNAFGHDEGGPQSAPYHFVDKNTQKIQNYITCHTVLGQIVSECIQYFGEYSCFQKKKLRHILLRIFTCELCKRVKCT